MKQKTVLTILITLLSASLLTGQEKDILDPSLWRTAEWEHVDSLGNHRVVLLVENDSKAVVADVPWRMREIGPEAKNLVIVAARTGHRVVNVWPYENNRSRALLAFEPVSGPGTYYLYYLTYRKSGSYYPSVMYHPFEPACDDDWVNSNRLLKKGSAGRLPEAKVEAFEAINELNSFYPMEIFASPEETEELIESGKADYLIFTEGRENPVKSTQFMPYRWYRTGETSFYRGIAERGEYFTFQAALFATLKDINNVKLAFSDLENTLAGSRIAAGSFTCFNTGGIDVSGNSFEKVVNVARGSIQTLWIGMMVPEGTPPGKYKGKLIITADGIGDRTIDLQIDVKDTMAVSHGDNEPWKHSRLRWLNSTIGTDNDIVTPFIPLELDREARSISCLGRTVILGKTGLPQSIQSYFNTRMTGFSEDPVEILASPLAFNVNGIDQEEWDTYNFEFTKVTPGTIGWKALSGNGSFLLETEGEMDFDGNIDYRLNLFPLMNGRLSDVSLNMQLEREIGKYMMGLGEVGGFLDHDIDWKWDVTRNQDGPWIGRENAGIQVRFRDRNYERPLNTNFYQQKPLLMPDSWYNSGKGGIAITRGDEIDLIAYSGERDIAEGERLSFWFNIAITPFKPLDTGKQWSHRFYHRHLPIDSIAAYGANTINIHHATDINPYINYPFLTPGIMKEYVDEAHSRDMKVKFYYTLRELSNSCPELFALRSLGTEIFSKGEGGGYSWLREHLDQDYIAAWFSPNKTDAAIINSGVSRWHNYYVEGLNWLVTNIGIDGIYIDDLAFDRLTMKRMRKVLELGNPGIFLDLHSANQYNPRDGFANSANLYLEHMPYIDRLWFGEYFDYDRSPDFWMVEVSGIPYGVMGEMLQDGGNPWRGMLYGMTGRLPWRGVTVVRPLWDLWDSFGIGSSEMIGYWADDNPVSTGSQNTLATAYVIKGERTLVSLATWHEQGETVTLNIDWDEIGLDPAKAGLYFPAIEKFQEEQSLEPGDPIPVPAGKDSLHITSER